MSIISTVRNSAVNVGWRAGRSSREKPGASVNAKSTIADLGTSAGHRSKVLELSDYVFHPLNKDEELILSRGHPKDTEAASILLLAPASLHPRPEALKKLEHEYSLTNELEPTWAVRPIALSRYKEQSTLVLEDPGGELLNDLIRGPMETRDFLRLAICLANALGHLHKRHLIHKDLKPSNILVDRAKVRVWFTGFGIASRLARERQPLESPEFIAGTLAYMAPEQTGRMNRSIDSRTDLYALGITLYELLTGSLPFVASDPMEWVHCHIARQPTPPCERVKNVPSSVSAIVMKLLAKTPEERYQTAAGAENDLRRCLIEWESRGSIDEFRIGERDVPDRLLIPEKLYGRESEIKTLLAAFDRIVVGGRPELVLVAGYSGIGKSSVINELHKPLVPPRGLFASGKFDQYKRDIPYSTLAQAFQGLIQHLLAKSEADLARWRESLREALGVNGRLMIDLVPELKLIIGEQPPVPDLPPLEAQRRFQLIFRRFIGVFAQPEHPLALFLDDLQWLDIATLELLEYLLTQGDPLRLLMIGAYRDNEVDAAHPLTRKVAAIRKAGGTVNEIKLAPLLQEDVAQLIAYALHSEPQRVLSLAHLVYAKTAGNPFFTIQFISALEHEGLLTFDYVHGHWSWELGHIRAKGYTDNVVDLIVGKLTRLPGKTQQALQQLAGLGNAAESTTLSTVLETSEEQVHAALEEAVRQELLERVDGSYRFVHDRVHEAAYSLIPETSRPETHLRIGRLLTAQTPPEKREETIFDVVNQLNRGAGLIASLEEREHLAELNLVAGKRAKASSAYTSALKYLITGATLLSEGCWERQRDLIFALELERAECEFLTAALTESEQRLTLLSARAANTVELARLTCLRVDLYTTLNQMDRAVGVCLEYLRKVGVEWSAHPSEEEIRTEYERIWSQLGSRAIEQLIELPLMSDPGLLATMEVLNKVLPAALFTDAKLLSLAICRAVNFSLNRGNSDASCVAYVWLGQIAGPHFGNYRAGFEFGRLGCELVEKRGLERLRGRTYMVFAHHVIPWTKHVRAGRDLLQRAFEIANKIGDLTFAAYSCSNLNTHLLAAGDPLEEVQREAENGLHFAQTIRFGLMLDHIKVQLGLIRTLRGLTPKFGCFDDDDFGELQFEHHLTSDPSLAQSECFYWIRKLQARFLAGDYASALDASLRAERLLWSVPSNLESVEYHFYSALSHAACWDSAHQDSRQLHFEAVVDHHRQLEIWSENCPENFENRAALVGAEIARTEGRLLDAEAFYEKAIRSAHTNGFVHNEAVANEVAGRFYAARGFEKIARAYLRDARYCYQRWGADGKVRQFDNFYPHLSNELPVGPTTIIGAPLEQLDLGTVIKVSQTVSAEMDLDKLIDTVMRAAIEYAGAARGLLILSRGDGRRIEAEATTIGAKVLVARKEAALPAFPESVVNYVVRTHDSVILDDASSQNRFAPDTYFSQHHARSVLCSPLITQGKLVGVLYLENNLAPNVFTSNRIAVLKLLASQAAISLENTHLYADLRRSESYLAEAQRLTHTGSCAIDGKSGETVYWSEEMFRLFGFDPQHGLPMFDQWLQRIHPEDREKLKLASDRTFLEKVDCDVEFRLMKPDGTVKHIHGIGHPVLGPNGELVQVVGTMIDITERRRAEESRDRLRQLEADLARVNRVSTMGELTASLAHEIKQPIGAAVTNAEVCLRLLDRDQHDMPGVRESALEMIKDARRAADIIERVRSLYQKGSSRLELVAVNDVIAEILVLLRNEANRHSVRMRTDLTEGLPQVPADRVQLQQVLMNLILNGIEAMRDTGGEVSIKSQLGEDGQLLISVTDNGVGLPAERPDQIFKAFFTTKPQGTGLGLSITRSIVESHGGRVWATANSGRGATFHFTLPIRTAVAA